MADPTADSGAGGEVTDQLQDSVAGTSKLDVSDLSAVLEDIHDAHDKWYGIGLRLGLTQTVLKGLEQEYQKTEEMLREMLGHWLKQVTPAPTWDALFQALRSKTVNEPSLAEQLLEKHHILPHAILTHSASNITDRHKQILGKLQATAIEVGSHLESYEEILQESKKADPSGEAQKAKKSVQRGHSDVTGLKADPEKAVHVQLKYLMSRIASLMEGKPMEELEAMPEKTMFDTLKDEIDSLRTCNSQLEEELHTLKDKLEELEAERDSLKEEKQTLMNKIIDKNDEIARRAEDVAEKSKDVAKKSAEYKELLDVKEELDSEVKKLTEENKLLKSQLQSSGEMTPPEASEPAAREQ